MKTMIRLFKIDEDYSVQLNKEWILLIPEFEALFKRDKGSPGDYRGDKKLRARKEFAYIYFMLDFTSPLRDLVEEDKQEHAFKYTGLSIKDIEDPLFADAYSTYEDLLNATAPALKTVTMLRNGLKTLDAYFHDVDFTKADRMGRLLNSPLEFIKNVSMLPKMHDAIDEFEQRVMNQLRDESGIRGKATKGGKEGTRSKVWNEGGPPEDLAPKFTDMDTFMEKEDSYDNTEEDEEVTL